MIKAWFSHPSSVPALTLLQIWSMKKTEEAAAKKKPKTSAAQIRVQKGGPHPLFAPFRQKLRRIHLPDLTELDLPSTMQTHFPDPIDLLNFTLTITPDEGALGGPPPRLLADARRQLAFDKYSSR
jgi:ubiquitin-conjugating enzyme E2 M